MGWEAHCHGQIRLMTRVFGNAGQFRTISLIRKDFDLRFCLHDVCKLSVSSKNVIISDMIAIIVDRVRHYS